MANGFFTENIAVKTEGEGKWSDKFIDQQQRQHKSEGFDKMLGIAADTVIFDAAVMGHAESADRQTSGDIDYGSRSRKAGKLTAEGNKAAIIGKENENE